MAFTKDGSRLVVLFPPGEPTGLGGPARRSRPRRRHAGADRSRDRAGALRRRIRRLQLRVAPVRPHHRRSLPRHGVRGRRAGVVGSPQRPEDADAEDRRRPACARAQPGRAHRGGRHRPAASSSSTCAPETCGPRAGGLTGSPNWVLFSPDGETLVSTNLDGTVTLWDAESATPRETLRGHSNSVQQPVFSPDGETLYTVSHDGTAIAWDLTGDRRLGRPFTFTHDRTFSAIVRRPPGQVQPRRPTDRGRPQGARASRSGTRAPHAGRGAPLETGGEVKALAFSPGRANARGRDRRRLLDALGRRFAIAGSTARSARAAAVLVGVSFSPDGRRSPRRAIRREALGRGSRSRPIGASCRLAATSPLSADGATDRVRPLAGGAEVWDVADGHVDRHRGAERRGR